MIFAHDTEASLQAMVDLVNTEARCSHSGEDELANLDHLDASCDVNHYRGSFPGTAGDWEPVGELGPAFRGFGPADRDGSFAFITPVLGKGPARRRFARKAGWDGTSTPPIPTPRSQCASESSRRWR